MSDSRRQIPIRAFRITDVELEELVFEVNQAFAARRRAIALSRNIDPFENYPVIKESFFLHVPTVNKRDGSIYVYNIEVPKDIICLEINAEMTAIISASQSTDKIEALAKEQDVEQISKDNSSFESLTGPLTTVQWGDRLVATSLAQAYKAITGLPPTMGGYKGRTAGSLSSPLSARKICSPFAVFALKLIEIGKIKRLGAGEFSIGVIRNAMSFSWSYQMDTDSHLERPNLRAIADSLPPKPPGRPQSGKEPWRVRDPDPVETEDCTPADLKRMAWEEYEVD